MNWDAVAGVGTVLGSLVVMVSVVYLAIQIRQSNRHAAASAEVDWIDGWNRVLAGWVESEMTITALRNGFREFDNLPRPQQAIFHMRVGAVVNHWLLATQLYDKGLISAEIHDGCTEFLISVLSTPGGRQYWTRDADATPKGREILAKIDSGSGSLPPLTELMPWWSPDDA